MAQVRAGNQLPLATEHPPPNEQIHIDSLINQLRDKMVRDYETQRTFRDAHPKMHGCVKAELTVEPELPSELAIGIFAHPRTFPAWVRFSNQNGTISPDKKGDIRGAAIKLMDVAGEKLLPNETHGTTHDFILISEDRFVTKDVAEFDAMVKGLIAGGLKLVLFFLTHWRVSRNLWVSLKNFGNPLEIRYFSVAPYLLGARAVKYSLMPRQTGATPIPPDPADDYLREAMVNALAAGGAVFDFSIQVQTDSVRQPIEDPGVRWSEELSPFRKVATLRIPGQVFDTPKRREFGDNLSFNPWRCLAEHRPLGGINRARKQVYQALSIFRHERNEAPKAEPTTFDSEWVADA